MDAPCAALLALEDLYARAGDWAALAGVYARQAEAFAEPAAKLAALRELARVQELNGVGAPEERARTYEQILALAPDDVDALRGSPKRPARKATMPSSRACTPASRSVEADATVAAECQLRLAQMLEAASTRRRWPRIGASCGSCPRACRPCAGWPAWPRRTAIPGPWSRRCDARRP